jgi:hypothetical protein
VAGRRVLGEERQAAWVRAPTVLAGLLLLLARRRVLLPHVPGDELGRVVGLVADRVTALGGRAVWASHRWVRVDTLRAIFDSHHILHRVRENEGGRQRRGNIARKGNDRRWPGRFALERAYLHPQLRVGLSKLFDLILFGTGIYLQGLQLKGT